GQGDREQQQREGEEDVHGAADHGVHPAAEVAGEDAEHGAAGDAQQGGQEGDEQGDARPVGDPAEQVTPVDRFHAEQVFFAHAAGRVDAAPRVVGVFEDALGGRVDEVLVELVGRMSEPVAEQRREDHDQDQQENDDAS